MEASYLAYVIVCPLNENLISSIVLSIFQLQQLTATAVYHLLVSNLIKILIFQDVDELYQQFHIYTLQHLYLRVYPVEFVPDLLHALLKVLVELEGKLHESEVGLICFFLFMEFINFPWDLIIEKK